MLDKWFKSLDKKVKTLRWYDLSLTKLSVFFFTLLLVKYFPVLSSFEWYWYLVAFVIVAFMPFKKFFLK